MTDPSKGAPQPRRKRIVDAVLITIFVALVLVSFAMEMTTMGTNFTW